MKALKSSQEELEKRLADVQLQHQQESAKLQTQLAEADSNSKVLEREVILCIRTLITCPPFPGPGSHYCRETDVNAFSHSPLYLPPTSCSFIIKTCL